MNYLDQLLQIQKDYATKMLQPGLSTDPDWQAAGNMSNPSAYNMGLIDQLRASQQNLYDNTQNLPASPNYLDLIALRGLQPDNFAPPAAVTPGSTQANNPVMVPDIYSYPGAPGTGQQSSGSPDLQALINAGLLVEMPKDRGTRTGYITGINASGIPGNVITTYNGKQYWPNLNQQNYDAYIFESSRDGGG